ncbi:NACHT domain-containing protein [Duganella callida]|uniref:NACHT domain-containing protein n=1 Tax=Duganella callida TaxID=2561932 RepID=A0A4Y9SHI9_9BURK|nr:NACHT domain-containing protein [Duganella callida]TFW24346.1 hypothetical protein E4L98_10340 [Duganella callida]
MANLKPFYYCLLGIVMIAILTAVTSVALMPAGQALTILAFIGLVLLVLRPALSPPGTGPTRVRIITVLGFFAVATQNSLSDHIINNLLTILRSVPELVAKFPWLLQAEWSGDPAPLPLILSALVVAVVFIGLKEAPIAGTPSAPLKKHFPEPTFEKQLKAFCRALYRDLEITEDQVNWSPDYVELEAEVEISDNPSNRAPRRILNLQTAIRNEQKAKTFLVLGEPGAGKSVALRKLALDMLSEFKVDQRIPIYINLREWLPAQGVGLRWSPQSPPTLEQLDTFVTTKVRQRCTYFARDFVDRHFQELWEHGRLFFIFDSFDEIPELLEAQDDPWLINQLSLLLSNFIRSGDETRGVLASRMFRRPTGPFGADMVLEIRPLTEVRIQEAMSNYPAFTVPLQNQLLHERPDWLPIVRNPFMMALLGEWVKTHQCLPDTQAQLYQHYLTARLTQVEADVRKHKLSTEQVLQSAKRIAYFVFDNSSFGLEAPVAVLREELQIPQLDQVIEILSQAIIARVTDKEPRSFAFVHRRFLEYLVTTRMLEHSEPPPFEAIPTDARGRDATVLYAQLCSDKIARELAELCWNEIALHFGSSENRRAIHSLRFLTDAFRSRRQALVGFSDKLAVFVTENAKNDEDMVQAKICLEATGLLSNTDAVPVLQIAMTCPNSWLRETAFRACRHLPALSSSLKQRINDYVVSMPPLQFWQERKALFLSLALSDPLRGAHLIATWRKWNLLISICALALSSALVPPVTMLICSTTAMLLLMDRLIVPLGVHFIPRSRRKPIHQSTMLPAGAIFRIHQHIFAAAVVLTGLQFLYQSAVSVQLVPLSGYLPPHHINGVAALLTMLGLLSVDWLLLGYLLRACRAFLAWPWKQKLSFILTMSALAFGILSFITVVVLAAKKVPVSIQHVVAQSMGTLLLLVLLWATTLHLRDYLHDHLAMRKLFRTFETKISRERIVHAIDAVRLPQSRLAVVRQIAAKKLLVDGDWPDGFKLTIRSEPAIIELGRLQERWEGLDR